MSALLALDELRSVRRHRRIGDVAWGDLAYRVYTTALGSIVLVIFASGWVGDSTLDHDAVSKVAQKGPIWAGLVAAVLLVLGARSGSRGGPLALEAADVHNLLLAPIPRARVLRRPSAGSLGYGTAGGAAAGALTGLLLAQRLPGGNAGFISCGVLFGAVAAAGAFGGAFLAASRRINAHIIIAIAILLTLASVAQATGWIAWSPMSEFGKVLFWTLGFSPAGVVPLLLLSGLAWLGITWIGGLSVEAAQRRTRLVGQLRFAVTQQDLRSVLLLRRQLASEHPISRSRLRFLPRFLGRRLPVFTRGLNSFGRWPLVRILRVLILCVAAGIASRGIWSGTTPLVLVAGLCVYVAALDAIEPLSQEIDHPQLTDSYPQIRGVLFQKHLVAPVVVMAVNLTVGAAVAVALQASSNAVIVAAVTVGVVSLSSVAGASVSVVGEAILSTVDQSMMPPEVAGPRVVLRTVWPPLVAVSGFVPILAAQRAYRGSGDVVSAAVWAALVPLVLSLAVFVWIRYRDDLHATMNEAMGR